MGTTVYLAWHAAGMETPQWETMDETLVARAQAARFDFLQVPFEVLVQQQFFPSHGLAAFLHKWHQSEILAG